MTLHQRIAQERKDNAARYAAVRLVHNAWYQVAALPGREADEASAKLDRIYKYLRMPDWRKR